jgi:hypothetical protein
MKDNWVWKDQYLKAVEMFLYFFLESVKKVKPGFSN